MPQQLQRLIGFAFLSVSVLAGLAAAPRAEHVVLISVDGLSAAFLREGLASAPENFPNFARLLREGSGTLNARCDYYVSETTPNHTSMLLGRPAKQPPGWPADSYHGYLNNGYSDGETYHRNGNTNAGYLASIWDVVHDQGLTTAFFAAKSKLAICYQSYNETNGALDEVGQDSGRNKVDYAQIVLWSDLNDCRALVGAVTNYLADHSPHFMFMHLADLDLWGHYVGWGSPGYSNIAMNVDASLGGFLAALESHPQMQGRTVVMLTADHGGGSPYNTHVYPEYPLNYTIPFLVWGPGWTGGQDLYHCFANRFDPGTNRLDYLAPLPPIRNSDAANLATALLGLPPVPGSSIHPQLGAPMIHLSAAANGGSVQFTWPGPAENFVLEESVGLNDANGWLPVTEGIQRTLLQNSYLVPPADRFPMRLYRLRLE